MSIVFVSVFVHMCLNNGRHLVAYEGDSRIFNVIRTPLHVLFAQRPRVQTPTQSKAMEEDE